MRPLFLAGMVSALMVAPNWGQPSPIVTETELLSVLDVSHPAVVASRETMDLARARSLGASTLENPTVKVLHEDLDGPSELLEWTVAWPLPDRRRRWRMAAGHQEVAAEEARHALKVHSMELVLRELYAEWALANARQDLYRTQAQRIDRLAKRQRRRAERGETPGLEAHRLEMAAGNLQIRRELAANAAASARADVRAWFPDLPEEALPELGLLPVAPEITGRHVLEIAAEKDIEAARLAGQASRRIVDTPEIQLGWQHEKDVSGSTDGPLIGLSWSIPLFRRNQAEKLAATARLDAAEGRLETVRREIESARTSSLEAYRRLWEAHARAVAALGRHQRILEGAEAAFAMGESGVTDLLDIYRSILASELAVLDLHENALVALRRLQATALTDAAVRPQHFGPVQSSENPSQETTP